MKTITLLLISLLLLSSCTLSGSSEKDIKITELEKQVQELKIANTKLQEENELLKIGGIPSTVQTTPVSNGSTVMDNNSLFPEGTTFEETNSADCYKKARENYIARGIKKCVELGYKEADIQADKCQLATTFINELKTQKTNEEANCGPM